MSLRRTLSRTLLAASAVAATALVSGAGFQRLQEYRYGRLFPPPGRLVSVGGYSLHLVCKGSGTPTVLIALGGYGASTAYAAELVDLLSARTRSCVYDPPGQGWSEAGPDPGATSERYRAFVALLAAVDLDPPLLLVGESSGAHVARVAAADPDVPVDGLVLVDPAFDDLGRERAHWSPEAQRRAARLRRLAPAIPILAEVGLHRFVLRAPVDAAIAGMPEEVRESTLQQLLSRKAVRVLVDRNLKRTDALQRVRDARIPADVPLVVLTARPDVESSGSAYQAAKEAYHSELATRSTYGMHVVVEGAEHAMIGDRPAQVAQTVIAVVEELARKQ